MNNININDYDELGFNIFRKYVVKNKRLKKKDLKIKNSIILERLGLLKDNEITKEGIILFFNEPTKWFNNAYLIIEKYQNRENNESLIIKGSIIKIYNEVSEYLKEYKKIPELIIQELLLNAFIYNDYESSPIIIQIYENKLVIKNMICENRLIKYVFYYMGLTRNWNKGINNILQLIDIDNRYIYDAYIYENEYIASIEIKNIIYNTFEGKIEGIDKFINKNYEISSLNKIDKKRLYLIIEQLIINKSLFYEEILYLLKINKELCNSFLNKLLSLNIISYIEQDNKYILK